MTLETISTNSAPHFQMAMKQQQSILKWLELKFFTKKNQKTSQEVLKNKEVKREMDDSSCGHPAESLFARVKGLQPAMWLSSPPLCLPHPQHSPCSAHGFSSQFPFPPGVAPSSAVHLRSSQATWEVGVGAVVGLPG